MQCKQLLKYQLKLSCRGKITATQQRSCSLSWNTYATLKPKSANNDIYKALKTQENSRVCYKLFKAGGAHYYSSLPGFYQSFSSETDESMASSPIVPSVPANNVLEILHAFQKTEVKFSLFFKVFFMFICIFLCYNWIL